LCVSLLIVFFLLIVYSVCSFSTLILLVGSSDLYKTVTRITYTVLVETLNLAQSIVTPICLARYIS